MACWSPHEAPIGRSIQARHEGKDNPNVAIVRALKKAGVELHVCGQAVLARKIDPKTIQPEIQLDLWALTTTSISSRAVTFASEEAAEGLTGYDRQDE